LYLYDTPFQIMADDIVSSLGIGVQDGVQNGWQNKLGFIKQATDYLFGTFSSIKATRIIAEMSNILFMQIWCLGILYHWPYMAIKINRKLKTHIPLIFKTKPWHVLQEEHRDVKGVCIYKTCSFKFRRMTSCHPWALASKMAAKMEKILLNRL